MTVDTRPAIALTTHEHIGFELGWDYAHHRLLPPAPYGQEPSPLRHGLLAGQAAFGSRTLSPTTAVRRWLQLRLHAWLRGRSVELFQVTPHYLAQLDAGHCPITREPLGPRRGTAAEMAGPQTAEASIDRVRNDAGYAAGNLVVMSARANHAKAAYGFRDAQRLAGQAATAGPAGMVTANRHPDEASAARSCGSIGGNAGSPGIAANATAAQALSPAQWARVATLCSFVEPLDHDEACSLPLLLLPPNRLRLFNPVQALQVFISLQLLTPGWSQRSRLIEQLVPGKPARRAFQAFFHALLPRVLEAAGGTGPAAVDARGGTDDRQRARWAVEDAWQNPLVLSRWTAFARQLTAAQCEALVLRAHARRLGSARVERLDEGAATEGWNLDSRGYVPHAVLMRRGAPPADSAAQRSAPRGPSSGPSSAPLSNSPSPLQARLPL